MLRLTRRLWRSLAVLTALSIVPAVVLGGQGLAVAVTYGPAVSFSLSGDAHASGPDFGHVDCNGKVAYMMSGIISESVTGTIECKLSMSYGKDWDSNSDVTYGSLSMEFSGTQVTGDYCVLGSVNLSTPALDSTPFSGGLGTPGCRVDSVCWTWHAHKDRVFFDEDHTAEGCDDVIMGTPPTDGVDPTKCSRGVPYKVSVASYDMGEFNANHDHNVQYSVDVWFTSPANADAVYWFAFPGKGNPTSATAGGGNATNAAGFTSTQLAKNATQATQPLSGGHVQWRTANVAVTQANLAAALADVPAHVQVYNTHPAAGGEAQHNIPEGSGYDSNAQTFAATPTPGDGNVNYRGITQSDKCRFFFGAKLLDMAGTTDEPAGALGANIANPEDPPDTTVTDPPDQEGCSFDISDPSTWASAGMCAAVGLLGQIWETLKSILSTLGGLAAAIASAVADAIAGLADAILDGIAALFIPSDGFFEDKFDGLSDAFDNSTLGNWVEPFADLVPNTATGCAGPSADVPIKGNTWHVEPMNACSGATAALASTCRMLLSAGFVLFGGVACLRIVGRAFGWEPSIGGGG